MAQIHSTAVVDSQAELGEGVTIGPYAVIEGSVVIGNDCVIRPHAHLIGPLLMGQGNFVGTGCVLGDAPQHMGYRGEPTRLRIGDRNTFREHVTIHRGSAATGETVIGSDNYFMVNSHVAHDCRVGDRVMMANGALLAGHCVVGDRVLLSGNCAAHQFVRIGRLALLSGLSAAVQDIPPFVIVAGRNVPAGVNIVGMRRAGLTSRQIAAVREAYRVIYTQHQPLTVSIVELQQTLGEVDVIQEMLDFLRATKRGIALGDDRIEVRSAEAA